MRFQNQVAIVTGGPVALASPSPRCNQCVMLERGKIVNIGQASELSSVSQRMIRHYEKIGLVPAPARRDSGYRDYSNTDVYRLRFIATARNLGFPIDQIRTLLELWSDRMRPSSEVKALAEARATELVHKIAALEAMRRALTSLAAACDGDDRPDCPIIERLEEEPSGVSTERARGTPSAQIDAALDEALEASLTASDLPGLTEQAPREPQ